MINYALKLGVYALCLTASVVFAYVLKYNFLLPYEIQKMMWQNASVLVPIKMVTLIFLGEFKGIFSYFRMPDLIKTVICLVTLNTLFWIIQMVVSEDFFPSREILLADLLFSILFILFFRGGLRVLHARYKSMALMGMGDVKERPGTLNVALVGANDTGSQIVSDLKTKRVYGLKPVVFLDDSSKHYGKTLHGVPVVGSPSKLPEIQKTFQVEALIIVSQNMSPKRVQELIELGKNLNLKTFIIPSLSDFISERMYSTRLRPVDFEDFLERKPVRLHFNKITELIKNKVVAVTGAGGSIGSELSRQLANARPEKLLLIDHSEYNLFKIEQDLLREGLSGIPILLDITNEEAVRRCFSQFKPHFVYHAAAYKHVPMLEHQPLVALQNNSFGTGRLALLSSEFNVERFVIVSTDKAIDPINYMGASKRIAELFGKVVQNLSTNQTQIMAVRFGNVLGSAGSVLPIFKEQIMRGGPVTVTHPEVTRYFMTIPEAVGLILEASSFQDIGGKTFVLDMGKPVKIVDIAKKMIELNHLRLGVDIDIVFTGLRPGEKMHEDLDYDQQKLTKTSHPSIWVFKDDEHKDNHELFFKKLNGAVPKEEESVIRFIQGFIPNFRLKSARLFYSDQA